MLILACSGEGALEAIYVSVALAFSHAKAMGVLCVLSGCLAVLYQRWLLPTVLGGLLFIHPAWTVSAFRGDCGESTVISSWLFTIASLLVIGLQLGTAPKRPSVKL